VRAHSALNSSLWVVSRRSARPITGGDAFVKQVFTEPAGIDQDDTDPQGSPVA